MTSRLKNETEKTHLLNIEMRGTSSFDPVTDEVTIMARIDRLPLQQKNYLCCLFASLLLLCTIYLSYLYAWQMAPDYHVLDLPHGSRVQFESYNYRKFVGVSEGDVVLKHDIPWLHSTNFEVVRHPTTRWRINDDNRENRCFQLKTNQQWLAVGRQDPLRRKLKLISLTDTQSKSTLFASVTQKFNISDIKTSSKKHGPTTRWPTEYVISQLKVCNEDIWLTATTTVVSDGSQDQDTETVSLVVGDSKTVFPLNDTATIFQLGVLKPILGVNLGGWFIPEVWMVPDFFANTSLGWTGSLCKMVNYSRPLTEERIQAHLETWITEKDIQQIASIGFNSLRVPIGYWNIIADPYQLFAPGNLSVSLQYLDWLMHTAHRYDLSVLIDLHGAPGSQNGYDHSGCNYGTEWDTPTNIELTLLAIEALIQRYSDFDNLLGIELLNEPSYFYSTYHHSDLVQHYQRAYALVRASCESCLVVFNELYSVDFPLWTSKVVNGTISSTTLLEPDYYNVVLDIHLYDWQEPFDLEDDKQHIEDAKSWSNVIEDLSLSYPVIVGEWCMSTGSHDQVGQRFVDASVTSFERAMGWYVWTWKTNATNSDGSKEYSEWDVQYQYDQPKGLRIL